MNYYKHHIGDYAAATAHLTWDEDMAYTRLLRLYYRDEKPLPVDIADVCRKSKAITKPQKIAVENVLREFFSLCATGWVQARAEKEVMRKQEISEANRLIAIQRESTKRARFEHEACTHDEGDRAPSHKPLATSHITEQEQKKEHASPSGSRLPENFPADAEIAWAKAERPEIDTALENQKFRDYWSAKAGKDGRKADWPATWRNWIRNSRAPPMQGKPAMGKTAQAIHTLEAMKNVNRQSDSGSPATPHVPRLGRPTSG